MPSKSSLWFRETSRVLVPQPQPSGASGAGRGGRSPRKLPPGPGREGDRFHTGTWSGWTAWVAWAGGSRLDCGLASHEAGMEAQAVHHTGSQMVSALPAQRLGLGCWEGRGIGTRISTGSDPSPISHKRRQRFRLLG